MSSNKNKRRQRNRLLVYEYLLSNPCVDCGETDPVVLEFDHQKDKLKEVSFMISNAYSVEKLMNEISKCDVVCANCHRRRTAKQQGWYSSIFTSEDEYVFTSGKT